MTTRFPLVAALLTVPFAAATAAPRTLTVCADPNNLPFSNRTGQGFENRLAELIARDLGARVEYVWWAQRRGYVRNTLGEAKCDIWPGVAAGVDRIATTRPYYRSAYVFVSRASAGLARLTLDDPRLRRVSVGVQMIGNDASNTPPAHALAKRGIVDNVRGYMVYGDYARADPARRIVDAVGRGEVDVALVWGPVAGFFARQEPVPLRVEPVTPASGVFPMAFDIAVGVRRDDPALKAEIDAALAREKPAIDALLRTYGVPQATE